MPWKTNGVLQQTSLSPSDSLGDNATSDLEKRECIQRLEQQRRILEATLSSMSDFAYTLDPAGRLVYVNQPLLDLWGQTLQEALGKNFFDLQFPKELATRLQRQVQEVIATGKKIADATQYMSPKGVAGYYEYVFVPVIGPVGTVEFVVGTTRDITVRKAVEEHVEQMEARYRGLLEAAPDGMVVVNPLGEIVLLNAQAEKQFGYKRDELLGQNVTTIIPKGFAERLIADGTRTTTEALAQQIGRGIELLGRCKDGSECSIEIMLSPLKRPEGILVTAAIRDITLRKIAERQLVQMEARYRGLLEAAPDGMVVVNEAGEIVLLNARAEKQFGYRRDELLGHHVKDIIPEGFAERLVADDLRTFAEAQAQQIGTGVELHGRRKDGTRFPMEIMLSPLESEEGVLVTAAIRDISERKQLARQLHQSQKMDAVGQLTGGIAHDFNNLLTVIIGNLGLLELLVSDNEAAVKRIKTAQKAAARGGDITRRLLVFSSNKELNPAFVSLGDSIQNMIEMASRGLGSDITITTQVDPTVPPLFVDPAGLESALLNLVVNARDAMPKGGSIVISSQLRNLDEGDPEVQTGDLKRGSYACVRVTDIGQGMSQETLERAFEPFFTTKPRDKSTGLGLAMVYGFAKQSGGIVRIFSELGHGTTVSFYLPIVEDRSHSIPTNTPESLGTKLGGTVLVVDDEPDILEVALVYLKEMGLTAFQARDCASALKMIAQHPQIDLLITDIIMPGGMNGAELGQKARAFHPTLKIIYSSGFPAEALAAKTVPLLDGPLLRKPYQHTDFAAIVQQAMKGIPSQSSEIENFHSRSTSAEEPIRTIAAKQIVLIIDDDGDLAELVCVTAKAMGFQCTVTKDAATFLKELSADTTLVLLDLLMPEMDGIELLRRLAERKCKADIVLMSGVGKRVMESAGHLAQVLGLSVVGHLQKPFQVDELKHVLQTSPWRRSEPVLNLSHQFAIQKEDLKNAIEHDEFVVYYQPQIEIASGCVIGVEALVRWQHPRRGLIFPDRFIGRMEKFGLIDELGWIVANRGMSEVGQFANGEGGALTLSLNASVNSLCHLTFPDVLMSLAEKHGVSPANVTIEITETGLIRELSKALDILTRLRMKQFKLSIDDFGTGYAMMQQFKTIPATELKIDKSFVQEMMGNNRSRIMVQKTIDIGHELGMQVMAEGVETQEQLTFLRVNGCDSAQGYFFSRPIPAKEMVIWLRTYRDASPSPPLPHSASIFR